MRPKILVDIYEISRTADNVIAAVADEYDKVILVSSEAHNLIGPLNRLETYIRTTAHPKSLIRKQFSQDESNKAVAYFLYLAKTGDVTIDISGGEAFLVLAATMASKQTPNIRCQTIDPTLKTVYQTSSNISTKKTLEGDTGELSIQQAFELCGRKFKYNETTAAYSFDEETTLEQLVRYFLTHRYTWPRIIEAASINQSVAIGKKPYVRFINWLHSQGLVIMTGGGHWGVSSQHQYIAPFLHNVGLALEYFIYKTLLQSGEFDEVVHSAMLLEHNPNNATHTKTALRAFHEVDVIARRGFTFYFISCKSGLRQTCVADMLEVVAVSQILTPLDCVPVLVELADDPSLARKCKLHHCHLVDSFHIKKDTAVSLIYDNPRIVQAVISFSPLRRS